MAVLAVILLAVAVPQSSAGRPQAAPVPVPRAEFISTMNAEFQKIDLDRNAILTRKEVEGFQRIMIGAAADLRRRALFGALDADRNGAISPVEFGRLELPAPPIGAAPMLGAFDGNRDGSVSLVEFRTAKLARFDHMDKDKDGIVTPAEMKAAGLIK